MERPRKAGLVRKSVWGAAGAAAVVLLASYFMRNVWFFRDPVRVPARTDGVIIAPADGQVIYLKRIERGQVHSEKLGQPIAIAEITKAPVKVDSGWLVGIYMSPLDVHFNYAPIAGEVAQVAYTPAKINLPMVDFWEYINLTYLRRAVNLFSKKYHFTNERNSIFLKGKDIQVIVVEIADKFVNKIDCFVDEGDDLELGQKLSFIKRGSQVDLIILTDDLTWHVDFGDQVYGGQTILAQY